MIPWARRRPAAVVALLAAWCAASCQSAAPPREPAGAPARHAAREPTARPAEGVRPTEMLVARVPQVDAEWAIALTNAALAAAMPEAAVGVVVRRLEQMPLDGREALLPDSGGDEAPGRYLEQALRAARPLLVAHATPAGARGRGWTIVVVRDPLTSLAARADPPRDERLAPRVVDGLTCFELRAAGSSGGAVQLAALANDRALVLAPSSADLTRIVARLRRGERDVPDRWAAAAAGVNVEAPLVMLTAFPDGTGLAPSLAIAVATPQADAFEAYGVAADAAGALEEVLRRTGTAEASVIRRRVRESSFFLAARFESTGRRDAFIARELGALSGAEAR